MPLNKSKGNMYPWVTHTWNVIKGKCPHDCSYCYMKRYPQAELRFDGKELKTDLGSGNFIFVGSSCDMWANGVPDLWIKSMLLHCAESPDNKYLFQSKNPARFKEFSGQFPSDFMLGCTIETNRNFHTDVPYPLSKAPQPWERMMDMEAISFIPKMVSIEPIMDFDLDVMLKWMLEIKPKFVSIGADSGNNHLPEPSGDKVKTLIEGLKEFTEVKIKDNLKRITGAE